jgi:hypothetical protein
MGRSELLKFMVTYVQADRPFGGFIPSHLSKNYDSGQSLMRPSVESYFAQNAGTFPAQIPEQNDFYFNINTRNLKMCAACMISISEAYGLPIFRMFPRRVYFCVFLTS